MANLDLDPLLKKGLRLLHSRSKDSAQQLKNLLEEALRQKQGKNASGVKDPFNVRRESPIARTKQGSPSNLILNKENKREHVPSKMRDEDSLPMKKQKLDSPHSTFKSHSPSPTPSFKSESSSQSRKSDESDSDADMNDLAMEIGINCTVCKSFEQTSGNQLVECQECHSLYHQECHKPAVSHQDVNDPRVVWYCAKCSRSMKKQTSTAEEKEQNVKSVSKKNVSRSTLLASSGGGSTLAGVRSSSGSSIAATSKNSNASSHTISSRPSPTKGIPRQSPFANLAPLSSRTTGNSNSSLSGSSTSTLSSSNLLSSGNGRTVTSSSSRNQNSGSGTSGPPGANSILNAEKRVHLMKKKAAAKIAERRKI